MNVIEKIKAMTTEELAEYLIAYRDAADEPAMVWWDRQYCSNCESIEKYSEHLNITFDCCWCELNGKCKYFTELEDMPASADIVKMWLESEGFVIYD